MTAPYSKEQKGIYTIKESTTFYLRRARLRLVATSIGAESGGRADGKFIKIMRRLRATRVPFTFVSVPERLTPDIAQRLSALKSHSHSAPRRSH